MRKIGFILAMMAMFTLSAEEVNLFKNGDFSEGTKHWIFPKDVQIVPAPGLEGKKAVAFTGQKCVVQGVNIDPKCDYELTFMAKGENIASENKNKGARIIIRGGKQYARGTVNTDGSCMRGTFDWKQGKMILKGSYFKNEHLLFNLWMDGAGTCYFTDFKLVKVNTEKKAQ